MSTIAPTFNALSVACPNENCKAEIDQLCRSKSGKVTKTPHRARVLAAGGTVPKLGKPKKRTTRSKVASTPRRRTQQVIKPGVRSDTIGAFVNDLEQLRDKWHLNQGTVIQVHDPESDRPMAASYDSGSWLVTVGAN